MNELFSWRCTCGKSLQSCPTLCNPMDCSLQGSSVHGILHTRILEWAAISSSRGSSPPREQTRAYYISCIGRQILYHYCRQINILKKSCGKTNPCKNSQKYIRKERQGGRSSSVIKQSIKSSN